MCQGTCAGSKAGVNEIENSVNPPKQMSQALQIRAAFVTELLPSRTYLENGYARIFGEVPLEFSNEAPAVI
jgi:hypothetical protein